MKLRPVGHNVLVDIFEPPTVTAAGVHLPMAWQQPSGEGRVIAAGPKADDAVKPGTKVYFSWIDSKTVEHGGKYHRMIDARNLIAVSL